MTRYLTILLALWFLVCCSAGNLQSEGGTKKAGWISRALQTIRSNRYPRIKAISYWHSKWKNEDGVVSNLRVDSSQASLKAYRDGVTPESFSTRAEFLFSSGKTKVIAPGKGIYHAAFPEFGPTEDIVKTETVKKFEDLVGQPVVWAYFSNNWDEGIHFPRVEVDAIRAAGRVPFIRMMMRSENWLLPDPIYHLGRIINGELDNELRMWAKGALLYQEPLMIEFGTEMNGDWFAWSGRWNGAGYTDGYGDPTLPDGPERFRDAYRHIIDLFRAEGVHNITWVFHADAHNQPEEPWNEIKNYYPGDEYIDWIGVSAYGAIRPVGGNDFPEFTEVMDEVYPQLSALSATKPIAILEWGVAEERFSFRRDNKRQSQ